MDYYPIQMRVEILLVTSCYRNHLDGPFGSYVDFTYLKTHTLNVWAISHIVYMY